MTGVQVQTSDHTATVATEKDDLHATDVVRMFRGAMLGVGYHDASIKEAMREVADDA